MVGVGLLPMGQSQAGEPSPNRIEFETRPANARGEVVCGLFQAHNWLGTPSKPAWGKIRNGRAVCVFTDVKPGTYAISAFHDENKNGKLDTNLVGMPTEDYGASRDARQPFSAPRFDDAKFAYQSGVVRLKAKLE